METIPKELRELGELLRSQDNRATDHPLFVVQELVEHPCDPERQGQFAETRLVWYETDEGAEVPTHIRSNLEHGFLRTGQKPDGYDRCFFGGLWTNVQEFFTEEAADKYISENKHNLKSPRVYAKGTYRNKEMRLIRNWLMSLASVEQAETIEPSLLTALSSKMEALIIGEADALVMTVPNGTNIEELKKTAEVIAKLCQCPIILKDEGFELSVERNHSNLH